MYITGQVTHDQIIKAIGNDLDKVSLALDLLGAINNDNLIQEVLLYLNTCTMNPIRSDIFESINKIENK